MGQSREGMSSAAFTILIEQYQWRLYGFLRGFVSDPEQARDLLQEVFCDAWRAVLRQAPPFTEGGGEKDVHRWLFHTAYCRAVSARRRLRIVRWESLDGPATHDTDHDATQPSTSVAFDERFVEGEIVRSALDSLSAEDAACLLLNILDGFTATEIASIVEITPAAAKKRLSRAKQRLRDAYVAQNTERQEHVTHVYE